MENEDHTPIEAKDYYSKSRWWSYEEPKRSGKKGINFDAGNDYYQEILTPEISETFGELRNLTSSRNRVNDISEADYEENGPYSRQILSTEIVEIVEDGKSITTNNDRNIDDLYVAVGEDDLDLVKWVLNHAVSPGSRIFLIHVSPPITLIPTPVGMFERGQLTPQEVRRYMNEVNNKRKDLLYRYIQLSNEAKVTAETLVLESKHKDKAILDLISILNIANLVMGIKNLPHTRRNIKLSEGEFVKKNAAKTCDVTLVYNGKVFVSDPYMDGLVSCDIRSQNKYHSKCNFFRCLCSSGCMREDKDNEIVMH